MVVAVVVVVEVEEEEIGGIKCRSGCINAQREKPCGHSRVYSFPSLGAAHACEN